MLMKGKVWWKSMHLVENTDAESQQETASMARPIRGWYGGNDVQVCRPLAFDCDATAKGLASK